MKRCGVILSLLCLVCTGVSGQLTVGQCYEKARSNYPLVRQYGLISESEEYTLRNASKGYLPQLSLSGRVTYQTDVTKIPVSIPGVDIPEINKDQYQAVVELSQVIWDGGVIKSAKDGVRAQYDVEKAQYEVEMYSLRERVNDLFFGILLIDEQIKLNNLFISDLQVRYDKIKSYRDNGLANEADLDAVRVEQLLAGQNHVQLETLREAYLAMLSAFTGEDIGPGVSLVKPDITLGPGYGTGNMRPELELFDAMSRQWESRRRSVTANNMPKINAFIQGGYGNPGLNMFRDKFSAYALGGVRLSWNFGSYYTRKNDIRKIEAGRKSVETQRETFLFNNSLQRTRAYAEYEKYRKIMAGDDEIIAMRGNILRAAEAKVENGTMSVNDMMREMNAGQNARLSKALHEIEMIRKIYELKNLANN